MKTLRQEWLNVLSTADREELERIWLEHGDDREFRYLRVPETGLCMIRARSDGVGRPFNLGEATISRSVVATTDSDHESPIMGVGYVLGRDRRHAEMIARFDALFQDSKCGLSTLDVVLPVLKNKHQQAVNVAATKTDSTRVEFFTMARGT